MTKLQQLQNQLTEAFARLQHLKKPVTIGMELAGGEYVSAGPHRWRRQWSIKGRNMTVGKLVSTVRANGYTAEQASAELDLPLAAITEALEYYGDHRDLIAMEASEERRRM